MTQRAFERNVARKTFVAAGVVALLLLGGQCIPLFGGPQRRERGHQPEELVAQLNAEIPTFDKVVAITDELRVAEGEVPRSPPRRWTGRPLSPSCSSASRRASP